VSENLVVPVRRFVDRMGPALIELSRNTPGFDAARLQQDAVLEVFNLCCGFLATDGRQTDDELWELLAAFGPLLESPLAGTTPSELRDSGLVERQERFVEHPSAMFEVLLAADRRDGSALARAYYDSVMEVAYALAAADLHTSEHELLGIERFRGVLLEAITRMERERLTPSTATASPPAPAAAAPPAELTPARPIDELLAELDELVGMEAVKREVKLVAALIRVQKLRSERGLPVLEQSRHLVFTGNPGTGKTTVARLLAQIYRSLGVVARGHLVESDRAGLVAGYVGQTATKVVAVFDLADEGVLIIDEAYSLVRGGEHDFGREAIDTIVKLVEDRRDRVVVILAGYPVEMAELVDANPGLRSRFPKTIHFDDYTTDELMEIFELQGKKGQYRLTSAARDKLRSVLDAVPRTKGFGNGRVSRNLFEAAVAHQATRIVELASPTDEQLGTLEESDIPDAADTGAL
jgi:Cdc6-like AAA superfamily ATPase